MRYKNMRRPGFISFLVKVFDTSSYFFKIYMRNNSATALFKWICFFNPFLQEGKYEGKGRVKKMKRN